MSTSSLACQLTIGRNMDKSPLSRLPAELRNFIYGLALSYEEPIAINKSECRLWAPPALLHCCREIRREARGLYYSSNIFRVDWRYECSRYGSDESLADWLEVLDPSCRSTVRRIYLDDEYIPRDEVPDRLLRCRECLEGRG